MGRFEFFRRLKGPLPRVLKSYFRSSPDLLLSGHSLQDCHFPKNLESLFEPKRSLTLLGPGLDHNTMFYNLHASTFPNVDVVYVCPDVAYFEVWAYGLRKQAVWVFPTDFPADKWLRGDFNRVLAFSHGIFLHKDAWLMSNVIPNSAQPLLIKDAFSMANVIRNADARAGTPESVFLSKRHGWYPREKYEAWLNDVFADPSLFLDG